ncbi:Rz.1-like protein [Leptolyngbya phage Lsp-JY19]
MPKPLMTASLLIFAAALPGCASTGRLHNPMPPPICPPPPEPPSALMQPPNYEQRLRHELLEPAPRATPKSEAFKP